MRCFDGVQGLYPESHGIVANEMYDIKLNESFSFMHSVAAKSYWYSGEPVRDIILLLILYF